MLLFTFELEPITWNPLVRINLWPVLTYDHAFKFLNRSFHAQDCIQDHFTLPSSDLMLMVDHPNGLNSLTKQLLFHIDKFGSSLSRTHRDRDRHRHICQDY